MNHNFNLDDFSGPLDLLLHMSKLDEINISEVKIENLIDQYITFIQELKMNNLNVAASYLEMMAELIHLKSKHLLPKSEKEIYEEESLTSDQLLKKILEYRKYKEASYYMSDLRQKRFGMFSKPLSNLREWKQNTNREEINLNDIIQIWNKIKKATQKKKLSTQKIHATEIKIENMIADISNQIQTKINIKQLFFKKNKLEIVLVVLSILELAKIGKITIEDSNSEIILKRRNND